MGDKMVTKNLQLIGVGVIALIVGVLLGSFVFHVPPHQMEVTVSPVPQPSASTKNVIQITDTGFKPTSLTIKKGEVVTFISKATAPVWPAGDDHPTHDAYPSAAYAKEGDEAKSFGSKACVEYGIRKGDVFEPCKLLLPEETFSFRFNERGTWSFHNHVRPEHTGKITVE
jgi:plastocyanin